MLRSSGKGTRCLKENDGIYSLRSYLKENICITCLEVGYFVCLANNSKTLSIIRNTQVDKWRCNDWLYPLPLNSLIENSPLTQKGADVLMKFKTLIFHFSEMISMFFFLAILPTEKKGEPEIDGSKLP